MIADRLHSNYGRIADRLNELSWLPNLLVRISVGFMFFSGAVGKLADIDTFIAMFHGLGIPAAPLVAPATAVVELVGGAALMLGLATRPVSLVLAMDMVGALLTDIGPSIAAKYRGAWSFLSDLFYSSEWLLICLLLLLVCVGAGRVTLDAAIGRRWESQEHRPEPPAA